MGNKTDLTAAEDAVAETLETTAEADKTEPAFTKAQLLKCTRYSHRKDALSVLLKDDERYTHEEVERMLKKFMNKKVK